MRRISYVGLLPKMQRCLSSSTEMQVPSLPRSSSIWRMRSQFGYQCFINTTAEAEATLLET